MTRILPLLIAGALVATAVAVLVATEIRDGSQRLPDSSYLQLTPGDAEFSEFPNEFADFPIYWVGDEFGGHNLRYVIRHIFSGENVIEPENSVSFIYGTCEIVGEGGCSPPLQVIIEPYCYVPPELVGNGTRPSGIEKMRGGADAIEVGGGVRLWTGDVTIKVYTAPGLMEETIAALTSPNGLGVSAGEDMPQPGEHECQLPDWLTG